MRYDGYCHGGPFAGKRLSHDKPYYRVSPMKSISEINPNDPIDPEETTKIGVYNWEPKADRWVWESPE